MTTQLRILRLQHKITLQELSETADISFQQLHRLELCIASPTTYQEEKVAAALERLITERKSALVDLEHTYMMHKGSLLKAMEVPRDE